MCSVILAFQSLQLVSNEDDPLNHGDIGQDGDEPDGADHHDCAVVGYYTSQDGPDGQPGDSLRSLHQPHLALKSQPFRSGPDVADHERAGDGEDYGVNHVAVPAVEKDCQTQKQQNLRVSVDGRIHQGAEFGHLVGLPGQLSVQHVACARQHYHHAGVEKMSLAIEVEGQNRERQSGEGDNVRMNLQAYQQLGDGPDNYVKSGHPMLV